MSSRATLGQMRKFFEAEVSRGVHPWTMLKAGLDAQEALLTLDAVEARLKLLESACSKQNEEICQTLGKALGYPWFKDDQANFPGATEDHGVCVGEHVAESIAMEAGGLLVKYRQALDDILSADETSTLEGAIAIARDARTRR